MAGCGIDCLAGRYQFRVLAVFASLLLFPGLVAADVRKLWHGGIIVGSWRPSRGGISRWIELLYTRGV